MSRLLRAQKRGQKRLVDEILDEEQPITRMDSVQELQPMTTIEGLQRENEKLKKERDEFKRQ